MAKAKKRGLSDKVRNKKNHTTEKVNPFEVKFNRQKHNVLGRKISKHDKGMPGLSRSKAIKKVRYHSDYLSTLLFYHRFRSVYDLILYFYYCKCISPFVILSMTQ